VNSATAAVLEHLEAERLAPVPRATHVIGLDVDDVALVLDHVASGTRHDQMSAATAGAYWRIDRALRCFR
jgi:hypothetical protein